MANDTIVSRQYSIRDHEGWVHHATAILMMMELRGHRFDLGPEGFLGHLVAWTIYNSRFGIIQGPYSRPKVQIVQSSELADHFN